MDTYQARLIRHMSEDLGNPNTILISQRHRDQINHAASMDKALLLFAHSQGNLFVNRAYDHALTQLGAESVRVVHVAPASPRATGTHTLAILDLVINGLRAAGSVLPNTDLIPPWEFRPPGLNGNRDFMGHGLLEIYLNAHLSTSTRIRSQVMQALEALRSPQRTIRPPYPSFAPIPWAGGPRPAFDVQRAASHELDSVSTTRFDSRSSPSNGYVGLLRRYGDTDSGFPYWQIQYPHVPDIRNNWRQASSRTTVGRGVSGHMSCETVATGFCDGVGRVIHRRHQCTLNHMLDWPDHSRMTDMHQPTELESQRNTAARGSKVPVASWTTLSTPRTRNLLLGSGQPLRFRTGEILSESEWRGVEGNYPGHYICEYRKLTEVNTVQTHVETFSWQHPGSEDQYAALQRWDRAFGEWQHSEQQRYADHVRRWNLYNAWRETCVAPPPPPGGGEECDPENPLNECLLPS